MAQVKPLKLLSDGNFAQLDTANDDLTTNTLTSKQLNITSGFVGEKIVIQADAGDSESKLLNIKNSSGTSVASIDEDGDMIVNDLTVNGVETVVGTITAQSSLLLQGDLSVSGSVTLGDTSGDSLTFNAVADSNLDMGTNSIINVVDPTNPQDAATKAYVDASAGGASWSLAGNTLTTPTTTEFIGSVNGADVIFKRNNTEYMRMVDAGYNFGGISFLDKGLLINDLFNGNNSIRLETETVSFSPDDSYYMVIRTGSVDSGRSGDLEIGTGGSVSGDSGNTSIFTADAPGGTRGQIYLDSAQVNVLSDILADSTTSRNLGASGTQWLNTYSQTVDTQFIDYNNTTKLELKANSVETKVNFMPETNGALTLGASGWQFSNTFTSQVGTWDTTDFALRHNDSDAMLITSSQVNSFKELNMNTHKIVNVVDPTADQDAATKKYVDDLTASVGSGSWSVSGNILSTPTTTEFLGSINGADVIFKRNDTEFMRLVDNAYNFGGIHFLDKGILSNDLFNGNNTIKFETESISFAPDDSYYMLIRTGNVDSGRSGDLEIGTGGSNSGDSGDTYIFTADAPGGTRGSIYLDSANCKVISNIEPYFDSTYSVGASGFQWVDVYAKNFGTSNAGDVNFMRNETTVMTLGSTQIDSLIELDMNSNNIVNVTDPVNPQDAATKAYVDAQITTEVKDLRLSFTASGAVAQGAPVYVIPTANETVAEADASSINTSRLIGIAESSISDSSTGLITISGFATIPSGQIDGGSFSVGQPVFLSETTGNLTSTAPTTSGSRLYQVGLAVASDKLVIDLKQGATIE